MHLLLQQGKYKDAENEGLPFIQANPKSAKLLYRLGRARYGTKDYEIAAEYFSKAITHSERIDQDQCKSWYKKCRMASQKR